MKKIALVFCTLLVLAANAQTIYSTDTAIGYYPAAISRNDAYINRQCRLDLYYPKSKKGFATIIWAHGGGLTGGSKEIPRALQEKGHAVVGVGYRLSPGVQAPAYVEDAAAAVAWVLRNIEHYGGTKSLVFLSGHSAGGYLNMMVALDKKYLQKHGFDADSLAGVIPFSGQAITHFTVRKERGMAETQPLIDSMAPLYHVRPSAPPLLLITGDRELELFGRYEENAYLARMMGLTGHKETRLLELDGYDHGGMAEPAFGLLLKEVERLVKRERGN